MALTYINPDHEWILDEIFVRPQDKQEIFELPDLEIVKEIL